MYGRIKKALGPSQKKSASLKSSTGEIIQDRTEQMERWVEHYSELYARENIVTNEVPFSVYHWCKKSTQNQLSAGWRGLWIAFLLERHQGKMASDQRLWNSTQDPYQHTSMRSSFSIGRRVKSHRTWKTQISSPYTKQGRQKRLHQLLGHVTPQNRGQIVCTRCAEETAIHRWKSLSRVSPWIQSQQINIRHGPLHPTAPGEVQKATKASLHCLHRSNQRFWSS